MDKGIYGPEEESRGLAGCEVYVIGSCSMDNRRSKSLYHQRVICIIASTRVWYLSERPSVCRYSVVVPVKLPEIPTSVDGEATDMRSRGKGRGVEVIGWKMSAPQFYSQRALSTRLQQTMPVGVFKGRHQQVR